MTRLLPLAAAQVDRQAHQQRAHLLLTHYGAKILRVTLAPPALVGR